MHTPSTPHGRRTAVPPAPPLDIAPQPPRTDSAGPPLRVVLVEPQIPPNTGNIARLCAATGSKLILVGELGFDLTDSALKRAGLDYWEHVDWEHVPDAEGFFNGLPDGHFHLLTTHADTPYTEIPAAWGTHLVFGKETAGLPKPLLRAHPRHCFTIPMFQPAVRSLNLSSAVAVVVYDVLRRLRHFGEADGRAAREAGP